MSEEISREEIAALLARGSYMSPHIEPDNCGNYVVMQPTYEARLKADTVAILDKIRAEIEEVYNDRPRSYNHTQRRELFCKIIEIIDKYKAESEGQA